MESKRREYEEDVTCPKSEECEIFQKAMGHLHIYVYTYDISRRTLHFFNPSSLPFVYLKDQVCTVEDIIQAGMIDNDYIEDLKELFEKADDGMAEGQISDTVIKMLNGSIEAWYHFSLLSDCGADVESRRVIGIIQDVSGRIKTEMLYMNEKQYRLAMMADSRRVYEINVTKDRFAKLESIKDSTDYGSWAKYSDAMNELRIKYIYKEDWGEFLKVAERGNLLHEYQKGVTEFYCEYRLVDEEGNISWSSSDTHLLKDPISEDIKGFIYVKDIDKQKRLELDLYNQAGHDSLTGIYNRRTAEHMIAKSLEESELLNQHAFLTIDFDDFKQVNDRFGHIKGDFLLSEMAKRVSEIIRPKDIFARIGGDEFIILLRDVDNKSQIQTIAESIRDTVHCILLDESSDFNPSVSIGIAIYPNDGKTFLELYKHSDLSLYHVKQHGKNNISFFT